VVVHSVNLLVEVRVLVEVKVVEHFQNEGEEEVVVNQGKSWSKDEESVH